MIAKNGYRNSSDLQKQIFTCFENSHVAVAIMDKNFNFIYVNKAYAEQDNRNISDFIDVNHFDLYPSDAKEIFEHVVAAGQPYSAYARPFEYAYNPERGVTYWDWTLDPILNENGEVELLVFTLNNVTKRVKMEAEIAKLDRLDLIGQMAGGLGHEIRNPLTAVRGFLQMLAQKEKFREERDCFELLISEIDRANSIITEFLSLAQKDSQIVETKNLNEILKKIRPLIETHALKLGINICFELENVPDMPANEKEIRQVILNLVQNGIEASRSHSMITVSTCYNNGYTLLSVKDEGCGIDSDVLSKLGTPFFTTKDSGTGLGLAVCYSIVERHRGRIDVETGCNGTKFTVYFPAVKSNQK
jgi:PAS domain S-box-containing protein